MHCYITLYNPTASLGPLGAFFTAKNVAIHWALLGIKGPGADGAPLVAAPCFHTAGWLRKLILFLLEK